MIENVYKRENKVEIHSSVGLRER